MKKIVSAVWISIVSILWIVGLSVGVLTAAPVHLVHESPQSLSRMDDGVILIDFGKVAFANLKLLPPHGVNGKLTVHLGEAFENGRVLRKPPGSVRYQTVDVELSGGSQVIAPKANGWNSRPVAAVLTPKEWGVVLPFRWVEIEGWQGEFKPEYLIRQSGYLEAWDDQAASFECSDETLNKIWELCRYSIKATSFAGIYVDGDRERIPYEADAYLNQLSHYYTDRDEQLARDTYDWLMRRPTWPTEWAPQMVFMAHADWMHKGDVGWLKPRFEAMKTKLLMERVGPDGWVLSNEKQQKNDDIVDWPKGERNGYVFKEVNTVVNAFHLAAVRKMADLAKALGEGAQAADYQKRYEDGMKRFNQELWMDAGGLYRDGIGTDHASAHANFFPLAFGLVPTERVDQVTDFLVSKGMVCSVYAAQYMMEALFQNGKSSEAIEMMLAAGNRSWRHMLESGTTITWEAWDQKYKPNQDWNHAWGAAPANLLPRYLLGVEPVEPGWKKAKIAPHLGSLNSASGKVPTPHGPIQVSWKRNGNHVTIDCIIPAGITAELTLPESTKPQVKAVTSGKHQITFPL